MFKRQLKWFIITGIFGTIVDFISYKTLLNYTHINTSKILSFLLGTTLAFFCNKLITFQQKQFSTKETTKFFSLYFFTLIINVSVNRLSIFIMQLFISCLNTSPVSAKTTIITLSFLAATGCSAILNFTGQKFFIFKNQ